MTFISSYAKKLATTAVTAAMLVAGAHSAAANDTIDLSGSAEDYTVVDQSPLDGTLTGGAAVFTDGIEISPPGASSLAVQIFGDDPYVGTPRTVYITGIRPGAATMLVEVRDPHGNTRQISVDTHGQTVALTVIPGDWITLVGTYQVKVIDPKLATHAEASFTTSARPGDEPDATAMTLNVFAMTAHDAPGPWRFSVSNIPSGTDWLHYTLTLPDHSTQTFSEYVHGQTQDWTERNLTQVGTYTVRVCALAKCIQTTFTVRAADGIGDGNEGDFGSGDGATGGPSGGGWNNNRPGGTKPGHGRPDGQRPSGNKPSHNRPNQDRPVKPSAPAQSTRPGAKHPVTGVDASWLALVGAALTATGGTLAVSRKRR